MVTKTAGPKTSSLAEDPTQTRQSKRSSTGVRPPDLKSSLNVAVEEEAEEAVEVAAVEAVVAEGPTTFRQSLN